MVHVVLLTTTYEREIMKRKMILNVIAMIVLVAFGQVFALTNVIPLNIYPPGYSNWLAAQSALQAHAMGMHSLAAASPSPQTAVPGGSQPAPYYAVIDLGDINGGGSYATGINNSGHVVGYAYIDATNYDTYAFLYANGSMQDLGAFGGTTAGASGINDGDQLVGTYFTSGGPERAFLYMNGSVQNLGVLSGTSSSGAGAINNKGHIVGASFNYPPFSIFRAFLYENGSMQDIGDLGGGWSEAYALNDNDQIVGDSHDTSGDDHVFLYANGSMQDLGTLGGYNAWAFGINNSGQVVGSCGAPFGSNTPFLYVNGSMQNIGTLGGDYGQALGINSGGQVVGYSEISDGTQHAFVYANSVMTDLNSLLINPNSGWLLEEATGINNAGQICGWGTNSAGQTHAFLLNPLPIGSIAAASTVQTSLPPYGDCPVPQEGQDSLVFITHGWISEIDLPQVPAEVAQAVELVNSMSNSVYSYLTNNGTTNWQVYGYLWTDQATQLTPSSALGNAESQGIKLGNCIAALGTNGWKHIHFIAHSAGAGMIQKATEQIRASLGDSVTIHCTFLDAYDALHGEMANEYGTNADWADSYFVRDPLQREGWTGRVLANAYNVDVTALDPQSGTFPVYESPAAFLCGELESSHGWPPLFYSNSIMGAININNLSSTHEGTNYDGFGFLLSEETGMTISQLNSLYPPGNGLSSGSVVELGPNAGCILPYSLPPDYTGKAPDYSESSTITSSTGTVATSQGVAQTVTGSPVWVATVITDTNALNYVSFDAEFTSAAGADGLLTVYWDTNMIGEIDEAAVQPGLQHYDMQFPNTAPNTSHVLGFHVDPFTETHSSLVLTNIITGCIGVNQPFSLSIVMSNGLSALQLTGQPAYYNVQSSPDLINWTTIAYLVNINGIVNFADPNSTNYPYQFYRATSPIMMSQ
jgi:probable HAF family extracellular repeat protein